MLTETSVELIATLCLTGVAEVLQISTSACRFDSDSDSLVLASSNTAIFCCCICIIFSFSSDLKALVFDSGPLLSMSSSLNNWLRTCCDSCLLLLLCPFCD